MTAFHDRIFRDLEKRRLEGRFRSIPSCSAEGHEIDCSHNSYLGLHANPEVANETKRLAGNRSHGNLASRLVAEHSGLYRELEAEIAAWERTETALVFSSGYAANAGVIQALCSRSTEVFCDRLNHASIYDGIRLSYGKLTRYAHCDLSDLKRRLLASVAPEKLIITDTVFSMEGDCAPLGGIAELAREFGALVMVDEAHATGLFGENGSGLVDATGTSGEIAIRIGTLSKAVAGLGGYIATSEIFRDFFLNFCRSFIYSTGLPHQVLAHDLAAVRYLRGHPGLGKKVLAEAALMRRLLEENGFSTIQSSTQIIPCRVGNEEKAIELSSYLRQRGVIVPAIRPPTVPPGTSRLRFSWSLPLGADHRHTIIDHLRSWKKKHG